jgi:hypothetical protein
MQNSGAKRLRMSGTITLLIVHVSWCGHGQFHLYHYHFTIQALQSEIFMQWQNKPHTPPPQHTHTHTHTKTTVQTVVFILHMV